MVSQKRTEETSNMSIVTTGLKPDTFIIQGWEVESNRGQFIKATVHMICTRFGNTNADMKAITAALAKSLNNPEVQKTINKQVGIELGQQRVIDL